MAYRPTFPTRRWTPRGEDGPDFMQFATGAAIAVVILLVAVGGIFAVAGYFHTETRTVVVTDKGRNCESSGSDGGQSCYYVVYTDAGTYKLTDSLAIGRFNSSDTYGQIHRCHRYEIKSYGFRFGLTSSYPNIKSMTDLGKAEGCEP